MVRKRKQGRVIHITGDPTLKHKAELRLENKKQAEEKRLREKQWWEENRHVLDAFFLPSLYSDTPNLNPTYQGSLDKKLPTRVLQDWDGCTVGFQIIGKKQIVPCHLPRGHSGSHKPLTEEQVEEMKPWSPSLQVGMKPGGELDQMIKHLKAAVKIANNMSKNATGQPIGFDNS